MSETCTGREAGERIWAERLALARRICETSPTAPTLSASVANAEYVTLLAADIIALTVCPGPCPTLSAPAAVRSALRDAAITTGPSADAARRLARLDGEVFIAALDFAKASLDAR